VVAAIIRQALILGVDAGQIDVVIWEVFEVTTSLS
jgi:hypothetical protein